MKKLPSSTASRIAKKMHFYEAQENPISFAKRLQEDENGGYRFRIGDYRIFFDVDPKGRVIVLIVLDVKHRRDAY